MTFERTQDVSHATASDAESQAGHTREDSQAESTLDWSTLFSDAAILQGLHATSQKRAFEALSSILQAQDSTLDKNTILNALNTREKLGSTSIGHGVAIPHARLPKIQRPLAAVVTLKQPLMGNPLDQKPIDIFVGLLVPEASPNMQLDLLAVIASVFQDAQIRSLCRTATDARVLRKALLAHIEDRNE